MRDKSMRRVDVILLVLSVIIGLTGSVASQSAPVAVLLELSWSPDGGKIAGAGIGFLRVWDAATGATLIDFPSMNETYVLAVSWSWDSTRLVSVSDDQFMRVWNISDPNSAPGTILATVEPFPEPFFVVTSVDWSPDGQVIAASGVSSGITFRTWDATTYQLINQLALGWIERFAWHPDPLRNEVVAAGDLGGPVLLSSINPPSGSVETVGLRNVPAQSVAWNSNGTQLAVGYEDATIYVWDVATDAEITMMSVTIPKRLHHIAWSPDDKRIASANGLVQVWDSATGQLLATLPGEAFSVAWSPDGKKLAYGGLDLSGNVPEVQIVDVRDIGLKPEATPEAAPTP
jgi:WD40 repeat protein